MTERLTDEVSRLSGILKVCGESVCKNRCSECDFLDTAIEKLRDYENIGTVEELKAIKQWKADIIESFSKYDVNSVDELMKRFRELTEKAEPKKYVEKMVCDTEVWVCPVCGNGIFSGQKYCDECGQAISDDWE